MSNEWTNGFWAMPPCSVCCESCFCPCLTFGKTHEIRKGNLEPESVNTACLCYTFGCVTGIFPVILCIERGRIRNQYGIEGGVCGDFWGSTCCTGNVLIQSELETIARSVPAAPPQPYQTVDAMSYAAQ
ncbi:PLAC8 family protein [Aspergillus minisclerotigenes]|uniref:PLAC8 family protein n=1 Tax=Aspergillus minisclerotigenes TaxID=656917 RepID=A0A5N6JGL8_9EURO|nr:PLAC8 family protein [Aspergillus minisclerotigenes]